jgi:hypothetical protein
MRLLGYRQATTVAQAGGPGTDEHVINYNVAQILFPYQGQIFHQHSKATGNNVALLKQYGLRPVVMLRNPLDCLVSLRERMILRAEGWSPGLYYPPDLHKAPELDQYHWLAFNAIPWYFSFFMSWKLTTGLPVLWLTYETYFQDQPDWIRAVLRHVGIQRTFTDSEIAAVCDHRDGKYNVGVSGRGEMLPGEIKDIVMDQVNAWKDQSLLALFR